MPGAAQDRRRMVERQLRRRGIRDPRVLAAMGEIPRERFVPEALAAFAYEDGPLEIGQGQTISQPYIVALMIEAAGIGPGDRVLEVGAGSGYAAAVLARIAARVVAIERHEVLAEAARQRVAALGCRNLVIHVGDGTLGFPAEAPYDAILVAAGADAVPPPLRQQLASGGRLVIPIGGEHGQTLLCVTRTGGDSWKERDLGPVRFVPLIGAQGRAPAPAQHGPR